MHSSVCGMIPSSAAMIRTAMSVICAPRARNALNVRLREAVAAENYEEAARLRDELNRLGT